ncbi:MAG: ABC transporter substrate-binding protein [Thermoplasmata archaeon]|nr:ABC transporter substrate-binding protein [Thermoplasmata archaeon]
MKSIKIVCGLIIGMMIVSSIPLFATAQVANDTLVIALQADMVDMNPWNPDTNAVWKSFQIGWNFEGMMAYNPDFELYPVLAAESATGPNGADAWVSADGLNISVNIRQGVTFHDGTLMDSQDVVFSYQTLGWGLFQTQVLGPLYWDDGTTFTRYDDGTTKIGVEANGTHRVDFHLTEPYAMFWYLTMAVPIMPHHIWSTHTIALAAGDYPGYDVTTEKGWDYSYGSKVTETGATIGTGPLMLESWIKEQGSVIKAYDGYWDKNGTTTWKGVEYPNYPKFVKTIKFKIYTQLDVAILALQNGDVHHLPWSLTPGYYNLLKTDPNIGIEINKDQGLFYMSFNVRKGAMADVNFRRAVAYCVDKQYIVDRLMGGYGIQGTVPISVTNTFYVNTSVPAWIAGGDLEAAKALLNANGYTDKDGDGWRDMPDGSPLKYNILTPPKDYDPIRADSGIMIEKNLKSIGLNIAAVPTSFDTIVSAAYVSVDFDMYVLGWSVGSFPESYLRDFFHSDSDVALNPAGSNAAGYHNATVDAMIDDMEVEMDSGLRMQLIKDICGATMNDVIYDTLYYRTNIEAYRGDIWQGWIPAFGTIYNGFSIFNLAPPGSGGGTTGGETGGTAGYSDGLPDRVAFNGTLALDARITMPDSVSTDSDFTATVMVNEYYGNATTGVIDSRACVGANVEFITDHGQFKNVTTDANGMATFLVTVDWASYGSINVFANASKGDFYFTMDKDIKVNFIPATATLSLSAEHAVIAPSGKTNVTAKVTDIYGDPISGVMVNVDNNLMFGWSSSNATATNAAGEVIFVYHAPPISMLPNTNRYEQFKANISVPNTIIPEVQSTSLIIGVQNSVKAWYSVDITSVTNYVITGNKTGTLAKFTNVTATVLDQDGLPVQNVELNISLSDAIATPDALLKTTNVTGQVTFNMTAIDLGNVTQSAIVKVYNYTSAYATSDTFLLCNANETNSSTAYAADIDFDAMVAHQGSATMTATVWDQTGVPAVGVPCQFFIPPTAEGIPGLFDGGDTWGWLEYGDAWDLGRWASYIGSWYGDNASVTDGAGKLVATITTSSFVADSQIPLEFGIGGYWVTETFNKTANNWWMEYSGPFNGTNTPPMNDSIDGPYYWEQADFTLMDSGILWRAPVAALASFEMDTTIISADDPAGQFTMTFHNLAGKLSGALVQISEGTAKPKFLMDDDTTSKGVIKYTYDAAKSGYTSDAGIGFTATVTEEDYSHYPFNFFVPYVAVGSEPTMLIVNATTTTPAVKFGDKANITAKVTDEYGNDIVNATVFMGGSMLMTDANGEIQTLLDIPRIEGLQAIPISATKSGYEASSQTIYLQVYDTELFLAVEYQDLAGPSAAPVVNTSFDISFTALNNGTIDGWTTFEFLVDDVVIDTMRMELAADEEKVGTFATSVSDTNFHNFTVRQINRRELAPWTLKAVMPAIAKLTLGTYNVPTNITQGEEFTVTASATNTGNAAGELSVPFEIDGVNYYVKVTLNANQTSTVSFKWTFTDTDSHTVCGQTVTPAAGAKTGFSTGVVAGAAIAMLIVGLLVGMILAKMMAGKKDEEPASKPEPMAEEESIPAEPVEEVQIEEAPEPEAPIEEIPEPVTPVEETLPPEQ